MYALVGYYVEASTKVYRVRIVALFHDYDDAADYERHSRLTKRQRRSFASDRVYRQRSLLSGYESAHIENYEEPNYPVNYPVDPTITV